FPIQLLKSPSDDDAPPVSYILYLIDLKADVWVSTHEAELHTFVRVAIDAIAFVCINDGRYMDQPASMTGDAANYFRAQELVYFYLIKFADHKQPSFKTVLTRNGYA
ncbi:MAG TPA: hypothetical protein VFQ92_10680, partial [Blastocatellia bacterium]|nr:hypothetical protein [Blastocatellia bacterium]